MRKHHVQPASDKQAWTRATIAPGDWMVKLPPTAAAELRAVLAELRRAPVPTFLLDAGDFALDACRATMNEVRRVTREGPMFAMLDRLPLAEMNRDEAVSLYWLLSSLLARPVAQKITGQMFYDVMDTGAKLKPGSGIRPTVTNVDLRFHNDNSYNETPPEYVCLLCLHPAKEGGVSQVMSVATVHRALSERHPELMARLHRPFWYDRHAEHHPGEPTTYAAPIFERGQDGSLKARLALSEIHAGYALRGERMDNETAAALEAVQSVFDQPELHVELGFEPGQIQYVNNRATGHARTEFVDFPEPERKRHLIRLWLRDEGKRGYRG
jgi:Taurine catabolism dioxygenase TauD, TfdA family